MNDDWDLFAVVRSCTTASSTATSAAGTTVFSASSFQSPIFSTVSNSIERRSGSYMYPTNAVFGELRDLYSPSGSVSSFSCLNFSEEQRHQPHQRHTQKRPLAVSASSSSVNSRPSSSNNPKSKRRKIQQKRVCHVPAEALNSDVWAWRKYGQKPIKGSPYPRGYYRCSTSKSCLARKQVERNRSDPAMFIVTFTAEHNHPAPTHRNSLAGSTRQKPFDQPHAVSFGAGDSTKSPTTTTITTATSTSAPGAACSSSSPVASGDEFAAPVDPAVGDLDGCDEDLMSLSNTIVSDDFFEGLEDFSIGDSFSGTSPASFDLSWIADNAATSTGGL